MKALKIGMACCIQMLFTGFVMAASIAGNVFWLFALAGTLFFMAFVIGMIVCLTD